MAEQLDKVYDPQSIEKQVNALWGSRPYFHPDASGAAASGTYTIVIPPPNVTAALHLGHALNNTLQDVLIRFRRMQQRRTLWMPGTDHAGIATQTVVEKRILAEEGKRRTDFDRDEFVARVQAWKDEYEATIIGQLKAMGCSCDWARTRFTMDEVCAKAVRANFFNLFRDGLIYRGKRLVNWDPATQTVLADDEVEHETIRGHFWYLRYPLVEPVEIEGRRVEHITVATTRPETMLGDTAVAMNPADPRARHLVGKHIRLPIVGRIIPIIADEHVVLPNRESEEEKARFSTGFLKVTPAHDPDDWAIGQRHGLPVINIMAPDGSISDKYGWTDATEPEARELLGMDRFEAREAVVEWFRQENLLEEVREYTHEVGHSYRSHVPIEPYLSDQWYIAVKKPIDHLAAKFGSGLIEGTDVPVNSLAGLALKPLLDGRLRFIPERYARTYQTWLENLRDWPISRQLWWGHRIPVWSKTGRARSLPPPLLNGHGAICVVEGQSDEGPVRFACVAPGREDLESRLEADGWRRDNDVLDTWFSSALWPFSTLGWPDDTPEMKAFYPGDVLCTAREIITLWVSRMVMMGQYCVGDIPFRDVYIHAMIQDGEGRKMSKSLGNGIDPLIAIDSHGADAMRFTLASMTTDTQDIRMPVAPMTLPDGRRVNTSPKFDIGRNFCNKLWNASRFAMINLEGYAPAAFDVGDLDIISAWILSRLATTEAEVTASLEAFKFSEPLAQLYRFFWNDFCDWYLEWVKFSMRDEARRPMAQNVLAFVLDRVLRLLHPFVPFITEGIYQKLNEIAPARGLGHIATADGSEALTIARWPEGLGRLVRRDTEEQIRVVQEVIRAIRDIRNKYNKSSELLTASANAPKATADILSANADLICQLANLDSFQAAEGAAKPNNAATTIVEGTQVYVHNVIDPVAERARLDRQRQEIQQAQKAVESKLANENFVTRAKPEVVAQTREKLAQLQEQLRAVEAHLAELNN
ncbi:MAG TPA: valine--tRNA ligase [Sedimentisphaerales bacterium]|nr:valine--tRNA ligase [Sedimentisphaerales bacterium]HRS11082.1 valine--tRNA ligase [Sedimentisphaerales bacterium]HRV47710.1 valine--tRNA ligase [Sedimentisphaerales bacterium]